MKILFDQCVPLPLKKYLPSHEVFSAYQLGWSTLKNGDLIAAAEESFELFITTDKNLKYQQNLLSRKIAIMILPTTSWIKIQSNSANIANAIERTAKGDFVELQFKNEQ